MATVYELDVKLQDLERKVNALAAVPGSELCSAEYPHFGQLSYTNGRYLCRCGQRYSKDGKGGLRQEPTVRTQ